MLTLHRITFTCIALHLLHSSYFTPHRQYNSSVFICQSHNLGLNPLYLGLPATMAASYAFMLPVATPVNALVFADGRVTVLDMVSHP